MTRKAIAIISIILVVLVGLAIAIIDNIIPDEVILYYLLWASLISSCLCLGLSTAMVGRKVTMLSYQKMKGINGSAHIESVRNVRTHSMRVLVGITFAMIAILLLADSWVMVRQWVNRILFVLIPLLYFITSILDWNGEDKQLEIELEEDSIRKDQDAAAAVRLVKTTTEKLQADNNSWKEMASEAVENLAIAAANNRISRGEAPTPGMAAVVPEHSSPITPEQKLDAERATIRAKLVASTLELGLPPRTVYEPETETEKGQDHDN